MDQKDIDFYVDFSIEYFRFLIDSRQWTGFGWQELNTWIKNFKDIKNGKYIACKILRESLGYSEDDMALMIHDAISDIINGDVVKQKQIDSKFGKIKSLLRYDIKDELDKTFFVPLLVDNRPGESADAIIRLMTQRLGFTINAKFSSDIEESEKYERIILVDDCIGSGEQFRRFFKEACIKNNKLFKDWCKNSVKKLYYLVLVGDEETISNLESEYRFCKIVCIELLNENHRVIEKLEEDPIYQEAKAKLLDVLSVNEISLRGFNDMEYAVFMHGNIPDWSLPLLYKSRKNWNPLLRRKDSHEF